MTTSTAYYNLPLYDRTTDAGEKFLDYRDDVNGTGTGSAFNIIDAQMKLNSEGSVNSVKQTTATITYYVDGATGSDITGDGTSGDPFATIQHAVDLIPKYLKHVVTIYVINGTYAEDVSISFFTGGQLKVIATGGYATVNSLYIGNTTAQIEIDSLKVTTSDSVTLWSAHDVKLDSCSIQPSSFDAGTGVDLQNASHVYIDTCTIDNCTYAIQAQQGCTAYSENTGGTGNTYAYYANSGIISYDSNTITATTTRYITNSGIILPQELAGDGITYGYIDDQAQTIYGLKTFHNGISITGNIVVSGTVDGRDVGTDGSKLDNLPSEIQTFNKTLNSTTGVSCTHNIGSTDYDVSVTPTANPLGDLGEVWVTKATNTCTIYCSGSTTTTTIDVVVIS